MLGATALFMPHIAHAVSCHDADCAALGYSKNSVTNCAEYIYCPFDTSYKACAKYNDEFTLDECPDNGICDGKYKFNSCKSGYYKSGTKCLPTSSCKSGEVEAQDGKCYNSKCVKYITISSSLPEGANVTRINGISYVVTSCKSGYAASENSNGCITCGEITWGGGTLPTCPNNCTNGYNSKTGMCCDDPNSSSCIKCAPSTSAGVQFPSGIGGTVTLSK